MEGCRDFRSGFTLIESLIVFSIMGALVAIVIVSINPVRQLAQVRNSNRSRSVQTLLDAIHQHSIENNGIIITQIDEKIRMLGTAATGCDVSCGEGMAEPACMDLSGVLEGDYLSVMPIDPGEGSVERTYYSVQQLINDRVRVLACSAELGQTVGAIR